MICISNCHRVVWAGLHSKFIQSLCMSIVCIVSRLIWEIAVISLRLFSETLENRYDWAIIENSQWDHSETELWYVFFLYPVETHLRARNNLPFSYNRGRNNWAYFETVLWDIASMYFSGAITEKNEKMPCGLNLGSFLSRRYEWDINDISSWILLCYGKVAMCQWALLHFTKIFRDLSFLNELHWKK